MAERKIDCSCPNRLYEMTCIDDREEMLKKSIKTKLRRYRYYSVMYSVLSAASVLVGIITLFIAPWFTKATIDGKVLSASLILEYVIGWSHVKSKISKATYALEMLFGEYIDLYNARISVEAQHHDTVVHTTALTSLTIRVNRITLDCDFESLLKKEPIDLQEVIVR